ncbi:MAG: PqqD family protein [Bacteroidales bacterium]|nr:PqqD family protein [Bacteroidales bacterium]MBN2698340.1 PqqD family protein [Bacteroidales bacterium]
MKLKKSIAISESGFVFDPMSGESFSVNEIGMEILELMKQDQPVDAISEYFVKTYDVEASDFEKYFYDFIGMLRQYQLIEDNEPA